MTDQSICLVCKSGHTELIPPPKTGFLGATSKGDQTYHFSLLICRDCGHIQKALDQSWRESVKDLYETYELIGVHISCHDGRMIARDTLAVQTLDQSLGLTETGSILDIGCGTGNFLRAFGAKKQGWNLAGYDVSNLNKDRILDLNAAFYTGTSLESMSETFDLITFNHVVEHLTDPVAVLKNATRMLKPDGNVVVRVPSFEQVFTDFFLMDHCSHFTKETLRNTLKRAGLRATGELDIAEIEIALVSRKFSSVLNQPVPGAPDLDRLRSSAGRSIAWASSLPRFVADLSRDREVGVFGVGGAGLWLAAVLPTEIAFFVDEDSLKQGKIFSKRQILSVAEIPEGSVVAVTFNNPAAAERMCKRLQEKCHSAQFVFPTTHIENS